MKLSILVPWVFAAGLLAGVILLFRSNQQKDVELAGARESVQQMEQLRQSLKEVEAISTTQSNQLVELRDQQSDVMRLRNENRQLREENQQLTKQTQTAQTEIQRAQAQAAQAAQAAQTARASAQQQVQQLQTENERLRVSGQQAQQLSPAAQINACINNLRQIDGAKQQWALERRAAATAIPTAQDLTPYFRGGMPTCPGGGQYSINAVNVPPTCSIPGHALPR